MLAAASRQDLTHGLELCRALSDWLQHEITFLKSTTPFTGVVGRTDRMVAGAIVFALASDVLGLDTGGGLIHLNQGGGVRERQHVAQELLSLAPSHFNLVRAMPFLSLLSASEVVTFLEKHDPSHFLSACVLAAGVADARGARERSDADRSSLFIPTAAVDAQHPSELPQAAKIFEQRTGIRFDLEPDRHFATPEQTWAYFLQSLNGGNGRAALSCFTSDFARQLEPLFTGMNAQQMQAMAASFDRLVSTPGTGSFREYGVTRVVNGEKRAALVNFVDEDGEWKISSM